MRVKIRLDTLTDVQKFINVTSGIGYDVLLTDGNNLTVSAKSMLAVLYSMEWSNVYCECEKNIYYSIQEYVIEE